MSTAELPQAASRTAAPEAPVSQPEYLQLARRAKLLSWASLTYMGVEGGVAVTAGIIAASPALVGFGIDSAIEGVASLVIVWRFTGGRLLSDRAERRAQVLVAIQFFLLAPYVAYEALDSLIAGEPPEGSVVGIALAISSLLVMPLLGRAKERISARMGSVALKGEGRQNVLCAYLSGALLVGLVGNAVLGLWWLDPAAALVIAAVVLREGVEAWGGEGCCTPGSDASATQDDGCCSEDACQAPAR